jgi:ABC-2 type transport system permease protein
LPCWAPLSVTSEFRTGTIRPTLLARPRRAVVLTAKLACSLAAGAIAGVLATGTAVAVGSIGLVTRGLSVDVTAGDAGRLALGGLLAGALWAAIGLGVGTIVRAQVPTIVGLFVWLLFVENLLAGDLPTAHQYAPAALARTLAGSTRDAVLASAPLAGALLAAYAAIAAILGATALIRRDVA